MAEINPFNDVPDLEIPTSTGKISGQEYLESVAGMTIGSGDAVIQANPYEGLWIGGKTFAAAPFSVDLEGNIVASKLNLGGFLSKTGTNQELLGSIIIRNPDDDLISIFIGLVAA